MRLSKAIKVEKQYEFYWASGTLLGTVLSVLHRFTHFLTLTLWRKFYYPHFPDKKTGLERLSGLYQVFWLRSKAEIQTLLRQSPGSSSPHCFPNMQTKVRDAWTSGWLKWTTVSWFVTTFTSWIWFDFTSNFFLFLSFLNVEFLKIYLF